MDRRTFLLGLGLAATRPAAVSVAEAAGGRNRIDLRALLALVGAPFGETAWTQSIAHVLELTPGRAPRVLMAELAVVQCRVRPATHAELARANLPASPAYQVETRGIAMPLEARTQRPLERFVNEETGRVAEPSARRWASSVLVTDDSWASLDEPSPAPRPRAAAQVAVGGDEWYVFFSAPRSTGVDTAVHPGTMDSTGWRLRPAELGQARVGAGYNHVSLTSVDERPWLGHAPGSPVRLLENATGYKVFEREALAPAAAALLESDR
jgi:hypothetical protein